MTAVPVQASSDTGARQPAPVGRTAGMGATAPRCWPGGY
jgi:hypothetical protein